MQGKRSFKRSGLHRLECEACDGYAYATVACLERHGLPSCGCGAQLVPDRLELAMLLDVDCPAREEYERELNSIAHGQAGPGRSARNMGRRLRDPSEIALERVEQRRRERALSNRLGALLPTPEPLPF